TSGAPRRCPRMRHRREPIDITETDTTAHSRDRTDPVASRATPHRRVQAPPPHPQSRTSRVRTPGPLRRAFADPAEGPRTEDRRPKTEKPQNRKTENRTTKNRKTADRKTEAHPPGAERMGFTSESEAGATLKARQQNGE